VTDEDPPPPAHRLEIEGLDRRTAEEMCLEIRRLARRHGLDVTIAAAPESEEPA
jgi:hypothetical protein